jgi:hypothetical protein
LITCQLTKLETALDHLKKAHPKLKPADAALLASALSLTGRHALAVYEGEQYRWPEDYEKLTKAMVPHLQIVQEGIDATAPKRVAKTAPEEEPIMIAVGLAPNMAAGENLLEGRDDLKAKLSEIIQAGVEFSYTGSDIGWQWALDRVNWNTVSGQEMSRRIKVKVEFTEGAVGVEMGTGPKKRTRAKAAAPAEAAAPVETAAGEAASPEALPAEAVPLEAFSGEPDAGGAEPEEAAPAEAKVKAKAKGKAKAE